ncbi:MAG: hypothetical protein HUU32_12485 [Calditrichaceae bacterium]|nr:hypothetical protein [Calditrichia bacterium]NUQ42206.1 hypothetical protein [Calditrichaceae bacterium]
MKKEIIIKMCAWCKKPMGFLSWSFWILRINRKLSHGICWSCQKVELEKLLNPPGQTRRRPSRSRERLQKTT